MFVEPVLRNAAAWVGLRLMMIGGAGREVGRYRALRILASGSWRRAAWAIKDITALYRKELLRRTYGVGMYLETVEPYAKQLATR